MIKNIMLLPPFAIGRLGSAEEPQVNYTLADDPDQPLGYRMIIPEKTLVVDESSGEIVSDDNPQVVDFKTVDAQTGIMRIRPVAPFLELFATDDTQAMVPLTSTMLAEIGVTSSSIEWRVTLANRKIERRTGDPSDAIEADTGWFSDHDVHSIEGRCRNFIDQTIDPAPAVAFGIGRFIRPNDRFPQIRFRFRPGKGLIYGPAFKDGETIPEEISSVVPPERRLYDPSKGAWYRFDDAAPEVADNANAPAKWINETLPPALYAIFPPAPSWLYNNRAVSRGFFDDACDGFVEARLTMPDGQVLTAAARICAGPPEVVPDSLFVRSLADDLEQIIDGPKIDPAEPDAVTRGRALDIVRRAFETVRFMNVTVLNGNNVNGRSALLLDTMAEEEAADTERAIRPIMAPETVDTYAIMSLHEQVYAALKGGVAPWFHRLMRQPEQVADYTDRGRRKMPAMMSGADNNYMALTYRQIDAIGKSAVESGAFNVGAVPPERSALTPRNLTAHLNYEAVGNPISSRPVTSVANCCPGLEVDFRAVWRRIFKGLVLREYDNLVVAVEKDCDPKLQHLVGRRILRAYPPGRVFVPFVAPMLGPATSDVEAAIRLTSSDNPDGVAPLEWSNALAQILSTEQGKTIEVDFTKDDARDIPVDWSDDPVNYHRITVEVRDFFEPDSALISRALAGAGELTQGLCSPWQNDYRECSCYYWASARPDFVNMEPNALGLSSGDNWLQHERTKNYVPDDYLDTRLILYDDLFTDWERLLRFQVGGRDFGPDAADPK
jgi:hypothetical protein